MIKKVILICGFLLTSLLAVGCVTAQNGQAALPGVVNLNDQAGSYPLGLYLEILEDPTRELTVQQVSSPEMASRFTSRGAKTSRVGVTRSAIWARFRINDQSTNIPYWLLEVSLPALENVDLYLPQPDGGYSVKRLGLLIPDSAQEIPDNHYIFKLPAGVLDGQMVYMRLASTNSIALPLRLWSPSAFNTKEYNEEHLWGIYFGVMLAMAVLNSMLFLSLKDRDSLYLVLYISAILVQASMLDGRIKDLLPADLGIQYRIIQPLLTIPPLFALLLFSSSFLKIRQYSPRLHKIYRALFVLLALMTLLLPVIDRYLVSLLFLAVSIPVIILVLVSGWIVWKNGYQPARFFVLAMSIPLLIAIFEPLSRLGLLTGLDNTYQTRVINDGALVILLSLALADRINYHKRQAEESAEKLRQSEALTSQFLDAQPVGVAVYGRDSLLRFINQATLDLFRLQRRNLGSKLDEAIHFFHPLKSGSNSPFPNENLPVFLALAGKSSRPEELEFEIQGERITVETQSKPIYSPDGSVEYAISVFQDISQRKKQEQEIRIARELYQSLVEEQIYLITRFQPDGALTFVNQAYCEYFGINRENLPSSNLFSLIPEPDQSNVRLQLEQIDPEHPVQVIENQVIAHDGEIHWTRWTNQGFFDKEGRLLEFQSTGYDISEQKQAEELLASYQEHLEDLVAERTKQEQYQRKIAESLQEVAAALNSSLDREIVLKKILEQLGRVIHYDGAALYLVEGDALVVMDTTGSIQKSTGTHIPVEGLLYPLHDVFLEGSARVISATAADPKWSGLSEPGSTNSWLGTPLIAGDRVIGALTVESTSPEKYNDMDLHVAQAFANHAAIAVVNADLHRKSRVAAVVEERNRIARDLHDSVTQTLFSASLVAEALPLQWEQDETGARENLARLHRLTRSALAEMRMLLLELRPVSLQQIRLATLIDNLREAYQNQVGVSIDFKIVDQNTGVLPFDVKEYLYRVTQEALNNITKHAVASQVHIQLEQDANEVRLCIEDNGQGFDPDQIDADHLGLQIMRERAAKVNARLTIESEPNKGTLILTEWKRST